MAYINFIFIKYTVSQKSGSIGIFHFIKLNIFLFMLDSNAFLPKIEFGVCCNNCISVKNAYGFRLSGHPVYNCIGLKAMICRRWNGNEIMKIAIKSDRRCMSHTADRVNVCWINTSKQLTG